MKILSEFKKLLCIHSWH